MKLFHIPDLDKDWLPEESTLPEESIPTRCSPHLSPTQDQVLPPGGRARFQGEHTVAAVLTKHTFFIKNQELTQQVG